MTPQRRTRRKLPVYVEKVYLVGAAWFWLQHGKYTDEDRERRLFEAFDREWGKKLEREACLAKA